MSLDTFVNRVKNHIGCENYVDLAEYLKEYIDVLTKNWNILDGIIDSLDLQKHTIPVLHLLSVKFECATNYNTDMMQLSNMLQDFLDNCKDEDLLRALCPFYELCHNYTKFVINQKNNLSCINILADAVEKVKKNSARLTPVHSDLCQLCLKTKHFETALRYLNVDTIEISTAAETLSKEKEKTIDYNNDAKYCLQYFYYGGMIYTAVKDYERALFFFELCLSVTSLSMSHIMLEAYKKLILLSLIHKGRFSSLGKQSTNIYARYMKPAAQAYHDLINAYATYNSEELNSVVVKSMDLYHRDKNGGLVNQVLDSLYKNNIKRLTKTFLTLSLESVAEKVQLESPEKAELYIYRMMNTGEIYASINRIDGMVVFHDDPERFSTSVRYAFVQRMMTNTCDWIKRLNDMEEKITIDPAYIKKIAVMTGNQDDDTSSTKSFAAEPTD